VQIGGDLLVPASFHDVIQQRPRSIARVGHVRLTAGQPVHQPRIDCTESQLALFGPRLRAIDMPEEPFELGSCQVGIEHEAGPLTEHLFLAGVF
jgi:hypothetical protein